MTKKSVTHLSIESDLLNLSLGGKLGDSIQLLPSKYMKKQSFYLIANDKLVLFREPPAVQ